MSKVLQYIKIDDKEFEDQIEKKIDFLRFVEQNGVGGIGKI